MPSELPSLEQLRAAFDRRTFERGEAYRSEGRVKELHREATADALVVTGRVRGSGSHTYEVYARVVGDEVDGDCSCPVAFNCKHVVAVLLTAIEGAPEPEPLADDLFPAPGEVETWPPGVQNRLLYILDVTPEPARLLLQPMRVRLAEDGSYGSATPFAARRAWEPFPPQYLLKSDLAILRALIPATDPDAYPAGIPVPADATPLLERIIATGRCHFRDIQTPPLVRGERSRAEARWVLQPDGYQRLTFESDGVELMVLPLLPPWYVEPASGRCGPLDTGLPDAILARLLETPTVPPSKSDEARRALEFLLDGVPMALPRQLTVRYIEAPPPIPHLHLFGLHVGTPEGGQVVPAARLSFAYGDHVIAWNSRDDAVAVSESDVVRIQRQKETEQEAVERLQAHDIFPLSAFNAAFAATDEDVWLAAYPESESAIWLDLQADLPDWCEEGWQVTFGEGFEFRSVTPDAWYGNIEQQGQQWFELELGIEVEGERISLLPPLLEWLKQIPEGRLLDLLEEAPDEEPLPLRLDDRRITFLPVARLRGILSALVDLFDPDTRLKGGRLHLPSARVGELAGLNRGGWHWSGGETLRQLADKLQNFSGIDRVAPPEGLRAELRPYQQAGLDWLQFLREFSLAGILADDMGLGKTIQALAHLLVEKRAGRMDRPSLVIAPTSLMFNWRAEAARFTPDLKVLLLHGPERSRRFQKIADADLVLTTYPLLARDFTTLAQHSYHLLILDEAQAIKNPRAQVSQAVRRVDARHRLCLTGTPMENHLGELWSVFDFLMPGLLGGQRQFSRLFRTPIEKRDDTDRRDRLARRIRPFFLRRTKAQVAAELPPKTEILRTAALEGAQRDLYETVRLAMHDKVRLAFAEQGLDRSRIVVLDALLKLRQVCCDPRLLKSSRKINAGSAKLDLLMELLPEMIEEGRRILLFSQFTTMLGLIEQELDRRGIEYVKLTGRTRDRATPVQQFQDGEVPLFLISLKAGGTGLNLTAADTVIHYDPWWNPAVEDQATDRAHRIGQRNNVFVYRLITEGTVEEKIMQMQADKRGQVEALFGESGPKQLAAADLERLFDPLE